MIRFAKLPSYGKDDVYSDSYTLIVHPDDESLVIGLQDLRQRAFHAVKNSFSLPEWVQDVYDLGDYAEEGWETETIRQAMNNHINNLYQKAELIEVEYTEAEMRLSWHPLPYRPYQRIRSKQNKWGEER